MILCINTTDMSVNDMDFISYFKISDISYHDFISYWISLISISKIISVVEYHWCQLPIFYQFLNISDINWHYFISITDIDEANWYLYQLNWYQFLYQWHDYQLNWYQTDIFQIDITFFFTDITDISQFVDCNWYQWYQYFHWYQWYQLLYMKSPFKKWRLPKFQNIYLQNINWHSIDT